MNQDMTARREQSSHEDPIAVEWLHNLSNGTRESPKEKHKKNNCRQTTAENIQDQTCHKERGGTIDKAAGLVEVLCETNEQARTSENPEAKPMLSNLEQEKAKRTK